MRWPPWRSAKGACRRRKRQWRPCERLGDSVRSSEAQSRLAELGTQLAVLRR
jgi:hypothetical protein